MNDSEIDKHLSCHSFCGQLRKVVLAQGLSWRYQLGIQSSKGLTGAGRSTSKMASSLGYWEEVLVSHCGTRYEAVWVFLQHGCQFPPECVIWERGQGRSHNALYVLILNVVHCHFCHMLFIKWVNKNSSHWRGGGLDSTFWRAKYQKKLWTYCKTLYSPLKFPFPFSSYILLSYSQVQTSLTSLIEYKRENSFWKRNF